jgi:transposase InsO family protein
VSDERWKPIFLATWEKQRKVLGARKLWLRLRRDGRDIARCTVERLMRELGDRRCHPWEAEASGRHGGAGDQAG